MYNISKILETKCILSNLVETVNTDTEAYYVK